MANLQQFTNNAASTLNAGISAGATTIVLTSGGGSLFPALSGSQYFYGTLSNSSNTVLEIVKVTARTTDTLTVVRAQEGTSASAFNTGDNFQLRVTAAGMNNLGQLDSANTWAQTQALNTSGNAATATKLAATKNIQGVAFDGSADITVATAGTGISVTGTSIANTGVLSVNGSTGALTGIGGNYILNTYTSPGTWTKPANLKAIKVTVVGGGGAGGTATGAPGPSVNNGGAGGGGGGGTAIYYATAASVSSPQTITAGTGTNSFGAIASATAGSAGAANGTGNIGAGGAGGTGSGGTLNLTGGGGGFGTSVASTQNIGGNGGASSLGTGPAGTNNAVGAAGNVYGGGGAGGSKNQTSGTNAGGAGASGIVIVEEFY